MENSTMKRDHSAFRQRMLTAALAGALYEKRGDPTMQDLANTLESVTTALDGFKRKHTGELDEIRQNLGEQSTAIHEIKRAVDKVETKLARPGALSTRGEDGPESGDGVVLRTPADFERRFSSDLAGDVSGMSSHRYKGSAAGEVSSLSDFVRGVVGIRTTEEVKASLAVGTDSAGGYAIPNRVQATIFSAMVPESSLMQAGTGFVFMDEGAKSVTTAITESIPVAAWRNELGNVAAADATFRGVVSVPRSLACVVRVSRELLADGHGMEEALRLAIAQGFAKEVDRVGLRGSGTAPEPRGLLNTTGVNAVVLGTGNGAEILDYSPILSGMLAIREESAPAPTAAIMAPRSNFKFGGLEDTTGQPIRKPEMLSAIKLIDTPQVPTNLTVGTSTDCSEIYIGDFRRMYFLVREALSIQLLTEHYSSTGEVGLLCHARMDVVIPYPKAFAVVTGVR